MRLAFDRDFDTIAPGGRRCDRVGALSGDAAWCNMEREELSGQVVERDVTAVRGPEAECLDVVSNVFHLDELEFAEPSDISSSRIVPLITCGHGSKQRRLGDDLDVLMAWTGGGKAFRKGKKQPRIAFQANFSSHQCRYQASLFREKIEPGFRVCGDMDVRLADEAICDLEPTILDLDRRLARFGPCKSKVEGCVEPSRLVGLEDKGYEAEQPGNRAWPEAIADGLHRFVLELAPGYRFGVRARHDVDGLGALLQRPHHFLQVPLLVVQVGTDDILAGRTHSHAVGRLVIGAMAETLPHGRGLRLADAPPIVDGVACVCHLLDPIGKAAEKLAVIMGKTRREVERALRPNGAYGTSSHAPLAFETGVVRNRAVIVARFTAEQHGAQQHEITEFWMNQVAVNAQVTQAGLDGDRLMRDDPDGTAARLIHLHGETHGEIHGSDAARLELGHNRCTDLIDLIAGAMELEVGHGPRRPAHRFSRHTDHKAQERRGPGIMPENLVTLGVERRARDVDYSRVSSAALHGETAQPGAFQHRRRFLGVRDVLPLDRKSVV